MWYVARQHPNDHVITAEDRPVGRLEKDPEKLKTLHALGMQDAQKQWQALARYLKQQQ